MEKQLSAKSKYLSLLLRHKPSNANLTMDKQGWVFISELLTNTNITKEELDLIVEENNKQRFGISEDGLKIKARQGHSIKVELQLTKAVPPFTLYHGTSEKSVDSIFKTGILKMTRNHVHLSETEDTATSVGSRHGRPVILKVAARAMHADGIIFYLSDNNVWLTDDINPKYINK